MLYSFANNAWLYNTRLGQMVWKQCSVWYKNCTNSGEKKSFVTILAQRTVKTKLSFIFQQEHFNTESLMFDKKTIKFFVSDM